MVRKYKKKKTQKNKDLKSYGSAANDNELELIYLYVYALVIVYKDKDIKLTYILGIIHSMHFVRYRLSFGRGHSDMYSRYCSSYL